MGPRSSFGKAHGPLVGSYSWDQERSGRARGANILRTCRHGVSRGDGEIEGHLDNKSGQQIFNQDKAAIFRKGQLVPLSGQERMTAGHLEKGVAGKGMGVCRRVIG